MGTNLRDLVSPTEISLNELSGKVIAVDALNPSKTANFIPFWQDDYCFFFLLLKVLGGYCKRALRPL